MMRDWNGAKVVIIGAARQGIALARYLAERGAQVTLTDQRPAEQLQAAQAALRDLPIQWVCGEHPLSLLAPCDCLCLSGGVPLTLPLVVAAQQRHIPLSNDSDIFLAACPCMTIGITGSAGKTTTTILVGRMAEAHNRPGKVFVGGNIGNPLLSEIDHIGRADLAVLELSSFQLELINRSPNLAAILNITPNHLDRHGTMAAYTAAKARILQFQASDDVTVLGSEDAGAWGLAGSVRGRLVSFGLIPITLPRRPQPGQRGVAFLSGEMLCYWDGQAETELMPRSVINLPGEHNLRNVLAACAIAAAAGISPTAMRAGVEGFSGVPHRLEYVRRWAGADWVNDSIATAPERTMAAIRAFDANLVLLLGGRDKHLPWEDLANLARQRVDHLILFGEASGKIEQAFRATGGLGKMTLNRCRGVREAILAAADVAGPGDVVLFSPGGTSFDEFRDFESRGEAYRKWVHQLS